MYLKEWAIQTSDLHGIKHVFRKGSRLRRSLWLAICIASLSVFLVQSTFILLDYFQRHHTTKLDITSSGHLEFPGVTVCNFNKYRESAFTLEDIQQVGYHLGMFILCIYHCYSEIVKGSPYPPSHYLAPLIDPTCIPHPLPSPPTTTPLCSILFVVS